MPGIMYTVHQRIKRKRSLYAELLFTGAAFFTMTILSYLLSGRIIHSHIRTNAENGLTLAQERLESEFNRAKTGLDVFAETLRGMNLQDVSVDQLREYIRRISGSIGASRNRYSRLSDFIFYYENFAGGPVIINNLGGNYPGVFSPSEHLWYQRAVAAGSGITEMPPYINKLTGEVVFTFACCVNDNSGNRIGVARIDVLVGNIEKLLASEVANQDGFGMLIDQDLIVLAHPNRDFVGLNLKTNLLGFSVFTDEMLGGNNIGEGRMTDYRGLPSVGFSRKLPNGCYLGIVLPEKPYYKDVTDMRWTLGLLALASAVVMITVLVRINAAKEKSDTESRQKNILNKAAFAFLSYNDVSFGDAIAEGVGIIAGAINLDSIDVWRNFADGESLCTSQIYRWNKKNNGSAELDSELNAVSFSQIVPRLKKILEEGKSVNGPVNLLPEAAVFRSFGIVSVFIAPVFINNIFWGGVLYSDLQNERFFDNEQAELMRSAAYLCANAVIREEMRLEIAEQNRYNYAVLSTAPVGFVMFDENFGLISCNEYMSAMCGVTREYYLEHFYDLSPEYQSDGSKSADKVREIMKRTFEGETVKAEWTHRTYSGELVPCEVTSIRVKSKDKFIGFAYVYDLRNIKKLEKSVIEAEERVKLILDATPLSCNLWDENYNIIDCNEAAVKLFGAKNKRDYVDNFFTFSPEYQPDGQSSAEKAVMYLKKTFAEGRCDFEWKHQLPDGTVIPAEVKVARLEYKSGYIAAAYAIDMREYKQMMERIENLLFVAQAANRAKSEFMARMSHEMLTPMNAVMGMTQIVKMACDPKTKRYMDEIDKASRDLLRIINEVLDMSNMEFGTLRLQDSVFSFYDMFESAIKIVKRFMEEKQQVFSVYIDHSIPDLLIGDEKRLSQVIFNLLSNAVKFTPERGEVRFTARLIDEDMGKITLQIEIADNGIGIPKEQLNGLFNIFEQVDGGNTRQHGGIGLGLAFSKRLIEIIGGRIWVESEVEKGSKFTFTVPVKTAASGQEKKNLPV